MSFDLRAEAGAEARLRLELDPVLLGERAGQGRMRHEAELDDGLAEPLAGRGLLLERALELLLGQEALLDQKTPEGPPGGGSRFHVRLDRHTGRSNQALSAWTRPRGAHRGMLRPDVTSDGSSGPAHTRST